MKPATKSAYKLSHEGVMALADIECVGLPVSLDRLRESSLEIKREVRQLETAMRSTEVYGIQRNRYKKSTSPGSREQISRIIYDHYGLSGSEKSDDGGYKFDKQVVENIQESPETPEAIREYLTLFSRIQKLQTLQSTFIDGLSKDCVNGRVHGFLNLHTTKTYRGSADSPNLNNLPSRDPEASRLVKGAVVPRPGYHIVEIDYSALEVHIAACYHHDPTMISYLNSGYDMHRDMAAECYFLTDEWKTKYPKTAKALRQHAKMAFVFSAFYGDYFASMTEKLWRFAKVPEVREILELNGIRKLGVVKNGKKLQADEASKDSYARHIKEVDTRFWNERFSVYNQWKKDLWDQYTRTGYIYTHTGFRIHGVLKRNELSNIGTQGSAFHCLLQSIIDINREIKQRKWKSRVVNEVHDSLISEVAEDELDEYISVSRDVMTHRLREKWKWIAMDLKTETETSEISWHDKKAYSK